MKRSVNIIVSLLLGYGFCYLSWSFVVWDWVSLPDATNSARAGLLALGGWSSLITFIVKNEHDR